MSLQIQQEIVVALITVVGTLLAALISKEGLFRWKRRSEIEFKLSNIYAPLNYEITRVNESGFSPPECLRLLEKSDEILSQYSHLVPTELIRSYAKAASDNELKTSPAFHDFCYVVRHQYDQCQYLIGGNKPYFNQSKLIKNLVVISMWTSIALILLILIFAIILGREKTIFSRLDLTLAAMIIAFISTFVSGYLERSGLASRSLSLPSNKDSNQNPSS